MMLLTMASEFKNGRLKSFSDQENSMIDNIVSSKSDDVVIYIGKPIKWYPKRF